MFHVYAIGHHISACKWLQPPKMEQKQDHRKKETSEAVHKVIKKEYVAKVKNQSEEIIHNKPVAVSVPLQH
ncbi:hypothetical protein L195_g039193 [Trifolium pratense]|uniref:Uncharacterized protein n=1 Tax=Trifolium pratense TaxID=57577 RepID=A0A2K3LX94_TRIPR|nr:hypothetical protein L195_g039193 [Trifolium pratense]